MQFFEDELLQLVGGFPLFGIDAGLLEQRLGAQLRLRQLQPETDVFCRQKLLR
jgi:hypothetical protein